MKATPEDQRVLLDLVELDRKIAVAEKARKSPPQGERITALVQQRQEQLRVLTERAGVRDDAAAELRRIEADVAVVVQRRERDAQRLAATSNAKDAQAFEHELETLARRQNALEDAQLEVMATLEDAEAAVAEQQALIDATTREGEEVTREAKAGVASATAEIEQSTRDREAKAGSIAPELLAEYERRSQRTAGAGLLRRGTCEACRMMLSGIDLNGISQQPADAVVSCPECGAILVRTDESGI